MQLHDTSTQPAPPSQTTESGSYLSLLKDGGFSSFLWTQFLGAFNDNAYKITVSLLTVMLIADPRQNSAYIATAGFLFVMPFVLFSGYAGQLADRFSKRSVLIVTKSFEILAMLMGLWAFHINNPDWMLVVVFMMALQSTFFSPAKYGILPEMLPERDLSRANGLLEMTTFVAIILGTTAASFLFQLWGSATWKVALILIAIAAIGSAMSFGITKVRKPVNPAKFRWNPISEVVTGLRQVWRDRALTLTILGISYFWFIGALFQMDLLLFAKQVLLVDDAYAGILIAGLAIGIGVGSMVAGRISGDHIELGMVVPGCLGMGVSALAVVLASPNYWWTLGALVVLGGFAGIFIVPLNAFLQHRPAAHEKGRIMGTNNFVNGIAMLAASGALWLFTSFLGWSPSSVIVVFGMLTIVATVAVAWFTPEDSLRFSLTCLLRVVYRIRGKGMRHVPASGPALLVANHVSFIDGFLIGSCLPRLARFLVWDHYFNRFKIFLAPIGAIPIPQGGRRAVVESISAARKALEAGEMVCIFPEGAITRTGNMQRFQRGLERIVEGLDVPVIPVNLGGVWGSAFSHSGNGFLKNRERLRRTIQVTFGEPLPAPVSAEAARQCVMELSAEARAESPDVNSTLGARFVTMARKHWGRRVMTDSTGKELSYGASLTGSVLLARWLHAERRGESMIGLLLPSSIGGALANIACSLSGKVPVNLNFTAGPENIASACKQCGIRTVLTSKIFIKKAKLTEPEGAVYLEDLLPRFSAVAKAIAFVQARLLPQRWLLAFVGGAAVHPQDLATIVFSSGSSGAPKGVMLSHRGILANVDGGRMVFQVGPSDVVAGLLPLFHSFGFTYNLWFPMACGIPVAFHPNPLDAKAVGELVEKRGVSILMATPTFLRTYMRVCSAEQFASLRIVVAGAEKLPAKLAAEFLLKYGREIYEGYGATEMSPVIAVNVPNADHPSWPQIGNRAGTVGQPLPGTKVRVVDIDSGEMLPAGQQGLLLVGGPSRMNGYWKQPERTAEALRGDWYVTGDIGAVDADGFITLTDRLSRFSKIAGEMVPLIRVEDAIREAAAVEVCTVIALPDPQKGERLVVLHTDAEADGKQINRALSATDMPKLWIPKAESIHQVAEFPMLPTGKLDMQRLKAMARDLEEARSGVKEAGENVAPAAEEIA